MKRVRVMVDMILEVPDDWEIVEPNEDVGVHLQAGDALLQPELYWLEYAGGSPEEGYSWANIDESLDEDLFERKKDSSVTMVEVKLDHCFQPKEGLS